MKDLSTTTESVTGVQVKDIKFNSAVNLYLGFVWDATSFRENKWTTCSWTKSGKCVNRTRPELDLR
jgi:hypothetical protein